MKSPCSPSPKKIPHKLILYLNYYLQVVLLHNASWICESKGLFLLKSKSNKHHFLKLPMADCDHLSSDLSDSFWCPVFHHNLHSWKFHGSQFSSLASHSGFSILIKIFNLKFFLKIVLFPDIIPFLLNKIFIHFLLGNTSRSFVYGSTCM